MLLLLQKKTFLILGCIACFSGCVSNSGAASYGQKNLVMAGDPLNRTKEAKFLLEFSRDFVWTEDVEFDVSGSEWDLATALKIEPVGEPDERIRRAMEVCESKSVYRAFGCWVMATYFVGDSAASQFQLVSYTADLAISPNESVLVSTHGRSNRKLNPALPGVNSVNDAEKALMFAAIAEGHMEEPCMRVSQFNRRDEKQTSYDYWDDHYTKYAHKDWKLLCRYSDSLQKWISARIKFKEKNMAEILVQAEKNGRSQSRDLQQISRDGVELARFARISQASVKAREDAESMVAEFSAQDEALAWYASFRAANDVASKPTRRLPEPNTFSTGFDKGDVRAGSVQQRATRAATRSSCMGYGIYRIENSSTLDRYVFVTNVVELPTDYASNKDAYESRILAYGRAEFTRLEGINPQHAMSQDTGWANETAYIQAGCESTVSEDIKTTRMRAISRGESGQMPDSVLR